MSRPTNKGHPLSPSGTTKDSSSEKTWVDGRRDEKEQLWVPTDVTPDGGLTAWLMVLGAWCVLFCSFGWINSIGVFQAYYEHDLLHQYSRRSHGFHRCRYSSSMSSILSWFNKKRGAVYGIVASGSIIGGVVFPIIISKLIPTVGFSWTMRVSAYMILFLLILANLTIKSRVPPNPCKLFKETLARPFHEFKAVLLIVGFFILTFSIFVPMYYLVSHLVAILNAGSLFSCLSAGIFADKIGSYNIFVVISYIAGIVVLALWIPAMSNAGNIVFDILFGFSTGAYVALAPGLVVKLSSFAEIGYRTGLLFLFASIGGLTTNPIAGAIWQHSNGSYTGIKVFSGVFLIVGSTLVAGVRLHQTGLKLKAIF
ncbi:major facilitator superfamily domain-containing protein [Aspergillus alliaceus]|uniref:major facilitator superfamily domain-containing protein n=1 Tax=Petromyces alliaceus TaxID=209559 RepID=UPI0012A70409|nr:major facilitator superfamily domain-containing protein [Aspergillus alliaceus]KAB8227597.1 major facilitator superfamily domain-containing protein [Aspergillus alliaceus]